ncbi:hypothetical protein ACS0TY_005860 [Phlomoides rotata]
MIPNILKITKICHSNFKNSFILNRKSELRKILTVEYTLSLGPTVKILRNSDLGFERNEFLKLE